MELDLKLNPVLTQEMERYADRARLSGCTLFRFRDEGRAGAGQHFVVRLEWPSEPGSEKRTAWSRDTKSKDYQQLLKEMVTVINSLTP